MKLRRRTQAPSTEVVLVPQPGGVLVAGSSDRVGEIVAWLAGGPGDVWRAASGPVADLVALGSTAAALAATHGEYVRLTTRSLALLQEHGLSPSGAKSFWGVARAGGRIKDHLDFERVAMEPSQVLALQAAATTLALRAAIKDVQAAVERVEDKLDDVMRLLRSQRVGDVLGAHRTLEPLVKRVRATGEISETDWSAVAGVGSAVTNDVAGLRVHVAALLEAADGGWRPSDRIKDAERLFDDRGLLRETLALLVIAEHNLGAWNELRLARVAHRERTHLDWTLNDTRTVLERSLTDDEVVLATLRLVADRVTTPKTLDGLAVWQRNSAMRARTELDQLVGWFAHERHLEPEPLSEVAFPTAGDALRHIRDGAASVVSRAAKALPVGSQRRAMELPAVDDGPPVLSEPTEDEGN